MPLSCIIIDDQIEAIELLKDHIEKIPDLRLDFFTTQVSEALVYLDKEKPDCVFLDIEMPEMTGLDFIETIKSKFGNNIPSIVLVTGYDQYALSGYEYGVFDYLLKPVSFKRFRISVDRLLSNHESDAEMEGDYIFVESDGRKVKVDLKEIGYVEGAGNYIILVTDDHKFVCYMTMTLILKTLPSTLFVRVHKSYIVSIRSIIAIRGNEVFLKTSKGEKAIPIGMTYRDNLLKMLKIS